MREAAARGAEYRGAAGAEAEELYGKAPQGIAEPRQLFESWSAVGAAEAAATAEAPAAARGGPSTAAPTDRKVPEQRERSPDLHQEGEVVTIDSRRSASTSAFAFGESAPGLDGRRKRGSRGQLSVDAAAAVRKRQRVVGRQQDEQQHATRDQGARHKSSPQVAAGRTAGGTDGQGATDGKRKREGGLEEGAAAPKRALTLDAA